MLHPHVRVITGDVIHGNGLIANQPIRSGEIVSQVTPGSATMMIESLFEKSPEEQERLLHYAYQCSETLLMFEGEPEHFMNHSCDPNTWWSDDHTMIARRDIAAGEEITYDYAMTEVNVPLQMTCGCGSEICRRQVTNLDHRDPDWQARYGRFLPAHTLNAIEKAKQGV